MQGLRHKTQFAARPMLRGRRLSNSQLWGLIRGADGEVPQHQAQRAYDGVNTSVLSRLASHCQKHGCEPVR